MARKKNTPVSNQGPQVEDSDLGAIISRELRNSLTYDQTQISTKRSITLEYVRGIMPDLPGRPNGSQQTSRDISDVMSWMLPGIMRTMTASDQMVRYEQVKNEDPTWAEQATAYANWSFFTDNDGYRTLYNATYDSLAMGNGVVRCYYDDEQTKSQTLKNQTLEQVAELMNDEDVRILSQSPGEPKEQDIDGPDGNTITIQAPTFNIKVERITNKGKVCDETCKPENLLINAAATTLEDARFVAYLHDDWTRSDLLEMGFSAALVEGLAPGPNFARNQVELARRYELTTNWQSPVRSGDRIDTYECYVKADADGDGIAEMIQVWYAGTIGSGIVLDWDYWEDDLPFTDIPCYPLPHRWDAESVADRTVDIQRVKTVLLRALLDSTYASVVPQRMAEEGSVLNPDALTNPRFGSTLWLKKGTLAATGGAGIAQQEIAYTGDKALAAMQAMDEIIAKRTGVSRTTMALDPEALTNQTATANQNLRDAGYSQIELVARNMSEYGWRKYFRKRLKLAIKYQEIAHIPVNKAQQPAGQQFQQVNPGKWDENMAVSINTGLGTGSRDRDMAMLNVMLGGQVNMAQQLAATQLPTAKRKALEFLPKILNSAILLAESAGIKNPTDHYPEITDQDVQKMEQEAQQMASQGSPEAALMQLKMQGETQAQQSAAQIAAIRAQAEQASAAADAQIAQLKLASAAQAMQDNDKIEQLKIQLQAATSDAENSTKLKSQALNSLTQIEVARIGAKSDSDSTIVSGFLEGIIGIQQHEQNKEMAVLNANLAPTPTPNGAVQ